MTQYRDFGQLKTLVWNAAAPELATAGKIKNEIQYSKNYGWEANATFLCLKNYRTRAKHILRVKKTYLW